MTRKVFSFAMMMVVAQRRHAQRLDDPAPAKATEAALARAEAARRTLARLSGSKRLLAFTMAV